MKHVSRDWTCALIAAIGIASQVVPGQTPPQRAAAGSSAATRFVVIGCVSRNGSSGPFVLTDTRGDQPVAYRLDGDASKLDLHVGHTLEVAGTLSPAAATGRGGSAPAPAAVLKVQSLTWIAKSCMKTK
jgi:hypothetical protein